jgi:hypothetical protein
MNAKVGMRTWPGHPVHEVAESLLELHALDQYLRVGRQVDLGHLLAETLYPTFVLLDEEKDELDRAQPRKGNV